MQTAFNYDSTLRYVHSCALTASRYTGKERDAESGLDYFGARYYASTMGRFISPDWAAKAEPVPYAKLDDPQSLNLYGYVRNNPLSRTDPDGHCDNSGLLCQAWTQLKTDVSNAAKTVNVTVEVGVGVKGEGERNGVTGSAGGSIHGELNYSRDGEKVTGKAEIDAGAKVGPAGVGGETGIRTTSNEKGAINGAELYKDSIKSGMESANGAEIKGNSQEYSLGGAVYTPEGGGGLHVAVGANEANKVVGDIKTGVIQAGVQVGIAVSKELGP